jgi:azurin
MKTKIRFLAPLFLLTSLSGLHAGDVKKVTISGFDTMKFNVTKIEAHPGEKLTVTLKNEGNIPKETMGHNWVLLKSSADPATYAKAAAIAKAEGYQPKSQAKEVIASIPVLGPKQSASTTFSVPSTPGTYVYLCSFPGHYQAGMKGVIIVK